MNEQVWWHTARGGGIVAFALISLSVIWGLVLSTRVFDGRPAPRWLLDLHRMLGGLALTFTGVHVASLVADSYVQFGPAELLVPFVSAWRPVAVAWGVIGLYLLLSIELTSLFMRRLPKRWWRRVHGSSYVLFWVSALHGATAGTDASHALYRMGSVVAIAAVLFLTLVRILIPRSRRAPARPPQRSPEAPAVEVTR